MNHHTLTPAENAYVQTLAKRLLHIERQARKLKGVPLESIHEETGMPVFMVICLLMEGAGWTAAEMNEVMQVKW